MKGVVSWSLVREVVGRVEEEEGSERKDQICAARRRRVRSSPSGRGRFWTGESRRDLQERILGEIEKRGRGRGRKRASE